MGLLPPPLILIVFSFPHRAYCRSVSFFFFTTAYVTRASSAPVAVTYIFREKSTKMNNTSQRQKILTVTGIGIFAALAVVVGYATSFIKVSFLSFDMKDIVIILSAFIYGPVSGFGVSVIAAVVEFLTYSTTGVYGLIMNLASSATFSLVAALVYSRRKSFNFAIIGVFSGVLSVTAVMMLLNMLVTPYYMGVDLDAVISLLPRLLLPFNLSKALFNGGIVLALYKPIVKALRRAHLVPESTRRKDVPTTPVAHSDSAKKPTPVSKNTLLSLAIGVGSAVVALAVIIILMMLNN